MIVEELEQWTFGPIFLRLRRRSPVLTDVTHTSRRREMAKNRMDVTAFVTSGGRLSGSNGSDKCYD